MRYRKLQADQLFHGTALHRDKVLLLRDDGVVEGVVSVDEAGDDVAVVKGILVPGFINCHCHLELSHMAGRIEKGGGLVPFLSSVIRSRQEAQVDGQEAMSSAEAALYRNGIAGVADVCNTTDAIEIKSKSSIQWYSQVEVLNLRDAALPDRLAHFQTILEAHRAKGLSASLVPHASYSVSPDTFKALDGLTAGGIVSIHNQESPMEDLLFQEGEGDFLALYKVLGYAASPLAVSGKSSLQTWLPRFTQGQTIILVHNTFIQEEDILFAADHAARYGLKLVYCLCPNANLYVEDALPPVALLLRHHCTVVIGTDSLASNGQLDIAAEMGVLAAKFPVIPLPDLLKWATSNGAEALRWPALGRFEKGKKPGGGAVATQLFRRTPILR